MKERPILFSAPMVRAILEGRKTQTRRLIKDPADISWLNDREPQKRWAEHRYTVWGEDRGPGWTITKLPTPLEYVIDSLCRQCPHGKPGDRLWVKETGWQRPERTPRMMREGADTWDAYYFDADGLTASDHEQFKEWGFKRRPSIFMPRWASRITLEIVSVRVERLNKISSADARAEGADCFDSYTLIWEAINGRGSWAANPWVWVIEFRRVAS